MTTVRPGTSTRWCASRQVVVPAVSPIAWPGSTSARGRARDRLLLLDLAVRLRLEARLVGAQARRGRSRRRAPCRRRPALASASRSRRTVISETPSSSGQLADAHGALAADLLDDQLLALLGEHLGLAHNIAQD